MFSKILDVIDSILWHFCMLIRQIYRRKGASVWATIIDPMHRADINQIRKDIGWYGRTEERLIPLGSLVHSHKIHYFDWVETLIDRIKQGRRIDKENPLKVCPFVGRHGQILYRVVDGNHRLMALRVSHRFKQSEPIHVKVYTRIL